MKTEIDIHEDPLLSDEDEKMDVETSPAVTIKTSPDERIKAITITDDRIKTESVQV